MGEFVDNVRNGKVVWPTQRKFDRKQWDAALSASSTPDTDDQRLHNAGCWFDALLQETRKVWAEADVSSEVGIRLARHFVGELNRMAVIVNQWTDDRRGPVTTEALVASQMPTAEGMPDAEPDAVATMMVDGARLVLSGLLGGTSTSDVSASTPSDEELLRRTKAMALLAQAYGSFEGLWTECVWNFWGVETRGSDDCICGTSRREGIRAVGTFRLNLQMVELGTIAVEIWRSVSAAGGGAGDRFPVVTISDGAIEISPAPWDAERPHADMAAMLMVHRLGIYETLKDLEVPRLKGLCLRHVVGAWQVLRAVARAQQAELPADTSISSVAEMEHYAPSVTREALIGVLRSWLPDVSDRQAAALVKFLSFVPNRGELWDAPLVEVEAGSLLLVHPAVIFGNPLRAFEFWMSRGGVSYETRGHAFEDEVEESVKTGLADQRTWSDVPTGVDKRVEIGFSEEKEEFDLVLQLGNWIWILETKCLNFPASAVEISNYFESLDKAAAQVVRKCNRARQEPEVALRAMKLSHPPDASRVRFRPLIVINGPLGAGFDVGGVPVADLSMLETYLRGKIDVDVPIVAGQRQQAGREYLLYSNSEEATDNFPHYLSRPPQIERLKRYTWQIHAIPSGEDGRERFVARRVVNYAEIEPYGQGFDP